jgi:HD superfamily phosphohydrolase
MDRLDYLRRDSYFTGVTEGVVGSDRIIKMLNVKDDQLVIDIKGIYSIEKFLVARRLMYWQVYFHKTVISSENLLVQILRRAKYLSEKGEDLFASPSLSYFLKNKIKAKNFENPLPVDLLDLYSRLDDNDIMVSAKVWMNHADKVLSILCSMLINRKLFRIEMKTKAFDPERVRKIRDYLVLYYNITAEDSKYLVIEGSISNYAYNSLDDNIKIMLKNGECTDISEVSDMLNVTVLSRTLKKHFLCYPKEIEIPF